MPTPYKREEYVPLPTSSQVPWELMERLESVMLAGLSTVKEPGDDKEWPYGHTAFIWFEGGYADDERLATARASLRPQDLAALESVSVETRARYGSHKVSCTFRRTGVDRSRTIKIAVSSPDSVFTSGWLANLKSEVEHYAREGTTVQASGTVGVGLAATVSASSTASATSHASSVSTPQPPAHSAPATTSVLEKPWVKYIVLPLLVGVVLLVVGLLLAN